MGKLMDLFQTNQLPGDILSNRIDKLYREKTGLMQQLNKLVPQAPKKDFDAASVKDIIDDLAAVWDIANDAEKRLIFETLITRIMLDGHNINIEWAFLQY